MVISMILAPVIAVLVHQVRCVVRFRASSENRPKKINKNNRNGDPTVLRIPERDKHGREQRCKGWEILSSRLRLSLKKDPCHYTHTTPTNKKNYLQGGRNLHVHCEFPKCKRPGKNPK